MEYDKFDTNIVIQPSDFPGDENIIKLLIPEMQAAYNETAKIAALKLDRSVLGSEARIFSRETLDRFLGLIE